MGKSKKGFALLVLAMILAVGGMLLITMLSLPPTKELADSVKTKNQKIDKIREALIIYYNANGDLPKPASFTATSGASYLAQAGADCDAANYAGIAASTYKCIKTGSVQIGVVPTRTLNLPDEYAFDDWGNRLVYAVDTNLSNGITLKKSDNSTDVTPIYDITGNPSNDGLVSVVIISAGKDGLGAYTKAGTLAAGGTLCPATTQGENCDGDSVFIMDFKATNYDDFTNYLAFSGCNGTTNICPAGIKAGLIFSNASIIPFRFTPQGEFKILKLTSSSTSPQDPWTAAFGTSTAPNLTDCRMLKGDNKGNTGCFIIGQNFRFMAAMVNPNSGISKSTTGTSTNYGAGTTNSYAFISCVNLDATDISICMLASYGTNPNILSFFRIDYGASPITVDELTGPFLQAGNPSPPGLVQHNCTQPKGLDEVFCAVINYGGYFWTYRLQNAAAGTPISSTFGGSAAALTSDTPVGTGAEAVLTSHYYASNFVNTPAGTPIRPFTGVSPTMKSATPTIDSGWVAAAGGSPTAMTCEGISDGQALCLIYWGRGGAYAYVTNVMSAYRWTSPAVMDSSISGSYPAGSFVNLDSVYAGITNENHTSRVDYTGFALSCFESVVTPDTFFCIHRQLQNPGASVTLQSEFKLFALRNCNPPTTPGVAPNLTSITPANTVTNTDTFSPSCFFNTTNSDIEYGGYVAFTGARKMNYIATSSPAIGSRAPGNSIALSYMHILDCSAAVQNGAEYNHYCIASDTGNAESNFSTWKITQGNPITSTTISATSISTPKGITCAAGPPTCATSPTNADYYRWSSTNYYNYHYCSASCDLTGAIKVGK